MWILLPLLIPLFFYRKQLASFLFSETKEAPTQKTALGDRMKGYEADWELRVAPYEPILVRLDGHKFSKFTKRCFNRPFDDEFKNAMKYASAQLLTEFNALTVFTQSDEITIYISPQITEEEWLSNEFPDKTHIYNGRTQKIASLAASFASIKFNEYLDQVDSKAKGHGYFDGRTFTVPNSDEVVNNFIFRARDGERNSKAVWARKFMSAKECANKTGNEMVEMVKENYGQDWEKDVDNHYKYGTFFKKELKKTTAVNQQSGEEEEVVRSVVKEVSKKIQFNNAGFIVKKYGFEED